MFILEKLPYKNDALEPYISKETLYYHHGKHNQAYVDNLNKLCSWTEFENMELEEIIKNSSSQIFNNSAQIYNHIFYWNCMAPDAGGEANWEIFIKIKENFNTFEDFKKSFSTKAATNFGSGWTWLVENIDWKLEIVNTSNADTVIKTNKKPLLTIDVWEHSYYIDTRNDRVKYIENFWNVVNWDFVNNQLTSNLK